MTGKGASYLSPPTRCIRLMDMAREAGGTWTPGAGARTVEYVLPTEGAAEVREYLRARATVSTETGGLAVLPAGRVFGSGVVISADGTALARDVAEDFGKTAEEHWVLGYRELRPPVELTGATAVVAVNRGAGYAHWLLEELPRLLGLGTGETENVVTHGRHRFAREALEWRGGRERVIEPGRATHFAGAPLIVPGLACEAGRPTPEALGRVREFGLAKADAPGGGRAGERVYLSRAKAGRRRVVNEAELWRELEGRGFSRVFLEELGWAEQIAVMRRARVVVAAHGAGLANLVFCAPGTRVVELFNRAYVNPGYWRVAALGGLDYRAVVESGDGAVREERGANEADVVAEIGAVRAAVG